MTKACFGVRAALVQQALAEKFPSTPGSLLELARRLHAGELSPWEASEESLKRIRRSNETLNCFVATGGAVTERHARALERSMDGERPLLWGVPVSMKDLASTQGMPTTFSSRAFAGHVPTKDAPLAAAMKAAGMVIVGKTNTPEFGILPTTESELNGICRNPWSLDWSAGGSSGGAAASVAAGLTAVAQGSDGAGSIRIPASCCGVFGVVLPHGRVPTSERVAVGRGPQDGVFGRSVADVLYYLTGMNAISERELDLALEVACSGRPESVVLSCTPPIDCFVDPACEEAAHRAAELLGVSGCQISERKFEWASESIMNDMMLLRSVIPVSFGDPAPELLDRSTRNALRLSEQLCALELQRTHLRLHGYAQRILTLFAEDEVLLTPVVARPGVRHGWITEPSDPVEVFRRAAEFAPFAAFVNLAGLCAVSVPLGWSSDGLPIGVQLASRPGKLASLLGLSARLERLAPWAHRMPTNHFG